MHPPRRICLPRLVSVYIIYSCWVNLEEINEWWLCSPDLSYPLSHTVQKTPLHGVVAGWLWLIVIIRNLIKLLYVRTSQPDHTWDQGKKISYNVSPCAGLTRFLTVLSASAVNQTASIFSYYWAALPLWLGTGGKFFLFADKSLQISQRHSAKYL